MFADHLNFVTITTDKMEGGQELLDELQQGRSGGIPWMTILDGEGQEIVSSVGPQGNVGCPVEPFEIEHFVDMIKQSTHANEQELSAIQKALTTNAKKLKGN